METLQSECLNVAISRAGAELMSIRSRKTATEYLWQGDATFWGGRSPILFPIVGKLSNGHYACNGRKYSMRGHGFARDSIFEVKTPAEQSVEYVLRSTDETLEMYPFHFSLEVTYTLNVNTINVRFRVRNAEDGLMPFSIGAHPGFRCPLHPGEQYEDYFLEFNRPESLMRRFINADGLIEAAAQPLALEHGRLPLTHGLFDLDALVFDRFSSDTVTLKSSESKQSVAVRFPGFSHLGIWAAPGAPFVCIEPWYGINDDVEFEGNIFNKKGILTISLNETFECEYSIIIEEE